jgi:hypothetical protein
MKEVIHFNMTEYWKSDRRRRSSSLPRRDCDANSFGAENKRQEKLDPNALDCFFCFFVYLVSPIIVLKLQV